MLVILYTRRSRKSPIKKKKKKNTFYIITFVNKRIVTYECRRKRNLLYFYNLILMLRSLFNLGRKIVQISEMSIQINTNCGLNFGSGKTC